MNISRLKQQWLPVSCVKKISSNPQRFILLGIPLVIYSLKDKIIALEDRCPHRGAPLSGGSLDGELLQCQYHGWRFNSSGECVAIPGLMSKAKLEDKKVRAYPAKIYLGLVFICLDQDETTLPLYSIPALKQDNYRSHFMQFAIEGEILNIIENTLDATHTHYIHAGLLRHDSKRQSVTATLKVNEASAQVCYEDEQKQSGWLSSLFESNRKSSIGRFHYPLIAELEYYGAEHLNAAFTFFLSPTTFNKHQVFLFISYRHNPFTSWAKKIFLLPFIKLAFRQDKAILKKQDDNIALFPATSFKSTELDLLRPHIERIFENKSSEYEKTIQLKI